MKKFKNIVFTDRVVVPTAQGMLPLFGKDTFIEGKDSYLDMIKMCIENPPQGGFAPDEMHKRVVILTAIKDQVKKFKEGKAKLKESEADGEFTLQFEDAVADDIKRVCGAMRWPVFHEEFDVFGEYVKEKLK